MASYVHQPYTWPQFVPRPLTPESLEQCAAGSPTSPSPDAESFNTCPHSAEDCPTETEPGYAAMPPPRGEWYSTDTSASYAASYTASDGATFTSDEVSQDHVHFCSCFPNQCECYAMSEETHSCSLEEAEDSLHPCLSHGRQCERGSECPLAVLPREWCVECLRGLPHECCTGTALPVHPCLRIWGECRYGDACVFKGLPQVWCIYCLRRQRHCFCDGVPPEFLPNLPGRVRQHIHDHSMEKKWAARYTQSQW